jgi:GTP-binding protein
LHKKILEAYKIWNIRISTAKLNNWLIAKLIAHPPPTVNGKRVKIRYMTQVKARPPSFVLFTSVPDGLPESYKRYLVNGLRDDFKMLGTPIRLMLRAGKNPYDDKTKKRRIIS